MWYYVTKLPWRDEDALPQVRFKAAHIHPESHAEPRSGTLVYGWIEPYEKLDAETVKRFGLIEGEGAHEKI